MEISLAVVGRGPAFNTIHKTNVNKTEYTAVRDTSIINLAKYIVSQKETPQHF